MPSTFTSCLLLSVLQAPCLALQLGGVVAPRTAASASTAVARTTAPAMDIDMNVVVGGATLLVSLGGGVALVAFTENAGKANEARENAQPCVKCLGKKVVTCTICQGTGQDEFAQYVAGVREMAGEEGSSSSGIATTTVDDWEMGERTVEMYGDILKNFPVKATENVCASCDGRGVIVCDNCQGTGIQPRFLERYSPDDFMD